MARYKIRVQHIKQFCVPLQHLLLFQISFTIIQPSEEVVVILGELENEGYDSSQATPDEIICYLWMKRKRVKEDLEKTNKALRKKLGDKDFQLLQVKKRKELNPVKDRPIKICCCAR